MRDDYEEMEPLGTAEVARTAVREIGQLTGKSASGITALEACDDGGWRVEVEVVEDRRIPSSGDLLAVYRADLTPDGDLAGLRRIKQYQRGKGDGDAP
ncbi:gas vesicle protein GvpO [Dactylosporangium sp. CS-047395]|uniref:gas vesicle protein GvpO n=1 Tax=Dactylosporangium sp. CS-047395 TaxID=3239936 RepID=UPI003D8DDA7E